MEHEKELDLFVREVFADFSKDIWDQFISNMVIATFIGQSELFENPNEYKKMFLETASQVITDNYVACLQQLYEERKKDLSFDLPKQKFEDIFKKAFEVTFENVKNSLAIEDSMIIKPKLSSFKIN